MVLSRFELDTAKRSVMLAIASPERFHGAIEESFPGERGSRRLWRLDPLGGSLFMLLVSETAPLNDTAPHQFGIPGAAWETVSYDPFLRRLAEGGTWRFRLVANPTVSRSCGDGKRGIVMPHITPEYQKKWLEERAEKHGFRLEQDEYEVTENRTYRFYKKGSSRPVQMVSVSFEGVLTVTDAALLRDALVHGIGREKAYGQGLLTLAPTR